MSKLKDRWQVLKRHDMLSEVLERAGTSGQWLHKIRVSGETVPAAGVGGCCFHQLFSDPNVLVN
jgi:hypothetical protein